MQLEHLRQTISSREFNQDLARAKRAAAQGPVVITDRGKPAYVLMTHEHYERLVAPAGRRTLFDLVGEYGPEHDFDFDPPKLSQNMGLRIPNFED